MGQSIEISSGFAARSKGKSRGARARAIASDTRRAPVQAARRKEPKEDPEVLLDIASRARVLAGALPEPDKSRILEYVLELEGEAAAVLGLWARPSRKSRMPAIR